MITAISWGPWRAEHRSNGVCVRKHVERGTHRVIDRQTGLRRRPDPQWTPVPVTGSGEAALREAIWITARKEGSHGVLLADANPAWLAQLVESEYA
jgi:hypothetical protein